MILEKNKEEADKKQLLKTLGTAARSIDRTTPDGLKEWNGNLCLAIMGLASHDIEDELAEYLTIMGF